MFDVSIFCSKYCCFFFLFSSIDVNGLLVDDDFMQHKATNDSLSSENKAELSSRVISCDYHGFSSSQ